MQRPGSFVPDQVSQEVGRLYPPERSLISNRKYDSDTIGVGDCLDINYRLIASPQNCALAFKAGTYTEFILPKRVFVDTG